MDARRKHDQMHPVPSTTRPLKADTFAAAWSATYLGCVVHLSAVTFVCGLNDLCVSRECELMRNEDKHRVTSIKELVPVQVWS